MIDWVDALCRDWAHYKRSAPSGLPGQAAFMAAQSSRSGFTQKIPAWMMQPEDISECDRANPCHALLRAERVSVYSVAVSRRQIPARDRQKAERQDDLQGAKRVN
jgi:hypothetical protein